MTGSEASRVVIAVGPVAVAFRSRSARFVRMLEERYAGFVTKPGAATDAEFDVVIEERPGPSPDSDVRVWREGKLWRLERGDFRAQWSPSLGLGMVRQPATPYALDSVLRIVHTLVLAGRGGLLLHAASAIRGGRAYVFAGASGAGKTTLAANAPADARLLSDEVSYVCKDGAGYVAWGTPFAGELARSGENLCAPLETIFLLAQAPVNRADPLGEADALRGVLANTLFFAQDAQLVKSVFHSAADLARSVPVARMHFTRDSSAWDEVGRRSRPEVVA